MVENPLNSFPKLAEYMADFELTQADLAKRILDTGAGTRLFAKEAVQNGFTNVYSLEHNRDAWQDIQQMYYLARHMGTNSPLIAQWRQVDQKSVTAAAEHIPYPSNFFGLVLSHDAIPVAVDDPLLALYEMLRVVEPGGTVKLFPYVSEFWHPDKIAHAVEVLTHIEERHTVVKRDIVRMHPWLGKAERGVAVSIVKGT